MNSALSKKQLLSLIVLIGLIFVLPLTILLTRQKQEVRKQAAGSGILEINIDPPTASKARGESQTYTITIKNISSNPTQIRVAGIELAASPNLNNLEISQINCGSSLDAKAFGDTTTGKIRLVCYKTPTASNEPLTIPAGGTITLGSFSVKVGTSATGSYKFSSKETDGGRNNIPLASGDYADLSSTGAETTLTIPGTATNPPATNTPAGRATVPPGDCPNGNLGNLNCDSSGLINEIDFAILVAKWHTDNMSAIPTPNPGHRSADITGDGNLVNELDFAKLTANWKTQ